METAQNTHQPTSLAESLTSALQPTTSHGLKSDPGRSSGVFVCELHGEYAGISLEGLGKKGRFLDLGCQKCRDVERENYVIAQKKRDDADRRERIARMFLECGIPKRHKGCSFENYCPEKHSQLALDVSKKYSELFAKRKDTGCSLVFCGRPGTGKTHLACSIANTLIGQGYIVKYTSALKACNAVKETYSRGSECTESQVLKTFQSPHLLIIDEVGMQFGTETEKMILYQIINARYEDVLPTIMISNLPEKELSGYIGERSVDRMREGGGAVVSFDWESYRK